MNENKNTHFIVHVSAAKMPSSCWGKYRRIGVLEVEAHVAEVSMISSRARGVVRVVETWEKLHVGSTVRSAFYQALMEAENLADRLNFPEGHKTV